MKYWSVTSQVLVEEAEKLWLKTEILVPEKNLFFIHGKGKSILFKSNDFWWNTSLGTKISNDKQLAYTILQKYGFPIAKSHYLKKSEWNSTSLDFVENFIFPLVIKPVDEDHGDGVMMDIRDREELREKLEYAYETYETMIIQEQVAWDEFRVLVLYDEVILAINRRPPTVIGDGKRSIRELIEYENTTNPLRGENYNSSLSYIKADNELKAFIEKQWFSLESVLESGQELQLRGNSNIGTGWTIREYTHSMHPDTKSLCIRIAKTFGLSLCGIDIITPDIHASYKDTPYTILELGWTPWLGGDRELTSVNTAKVILEKLFY